MWYQLDLHWINGQPLAPPLRILLGVLIHEHPITSPATVLSYRHGIVGQDMQFENRIVGLRTVATVRRISSPSPCNELDKCKRDACGADSHT